MIHHYSPDDILIVTSALAFRGTPVIHNIKESEKLERL